jgi:hypothetical protein
MAAAQPSGSEVLQPFNIPTGIGGGPPIQAPPRMNLTFPVFTPPAASSYGTTTPITVPWSPPDLAGAINSGINTGAKLATDALVNRKTMAEIQAEEQAAKVGIAQLHDPNLQRNISTQVGPGGFTARVLSPAEVALAQQQLAAEQAKTAASQAETAAKYGTTAPSQAQIEKIKAETEQEKAKTALMGTNVFERRGAAGATDNTAATTDETTNPDRDYTGY